MIANKWPKIVDATAQLRADMSAAIDNRHASKGHIQFEKGERSEPDPMAEFDLSPLLQNQLVEMNEILITVRILGGRRS